MWRQVRAMRWTNNTLVVATKNRGKAREFASMFEPLGVRALSLHDVDPVPDVVEDGDTFLANARKKARAVAEQLRLPVLADDSGLCVDLLGGAPGVYSARYAGEGAGDAANNDKLLRELARRLPDDFSGQLLSPARFVCSLVLYDPASGEEIRAEGECAGYIVKEPRGGGGFGYDPLFYVPEYGRTMAELDPETKNRISHRARAIKKLLEQLR